MVDDLNFIKALIIDSLEAKKAEDITVMDLGDKTSLAKYMIFASGRSTRNVAAIADFVADELKHKTNIARVSIEGLGQSEWVVLDIGDIIIHVFHPEARARYRLEDLWHK